MKSSEGVACRQWPCQGQNCRGKLGKIEISCLLRETLDPLLSYIKRSPHHHHHHNTDYTQCMIWTWWLHRTTTSPGQRLSPNSLARSSSSRGCLRPCSTTFPSAFSSSATPSSSYGSWGWENNKTHHQRISKKFYFWVGVLSNTGVPKIALITIVSAIKVQSPHSVAHPGGGVQAASPKQRRTHKFGEPESSEGAPHHRPPPRHHVPHHPQEPLLGGHPREDHLQVHHPRAHLLPRLLHLPPLLLSQLGGLPNGEEPMGPMAEQPRHRNSAAIRPQLDCNPGVHRGVWGFEPDTIVHVPDREELARPLGQAGHRRVPGASCKSSAVEVGGQLDHHDDGDEGRTIGAPAGPGDQQPGRDRGDRGDWGGEGGGEQGVRTRGDGAGNWELGSGIWVWWRERLDPDLGADKLHWWEMDSSWGTPAGKQGKRWVGENMNVGRKED